MQRRLLLPLLMTLTLAFGVLPACGGGHHHDSSPTPTPTVTPAAVLLKFPAQNDVTRVSVEDSSGAIVTASIPVATSGTAWAFVPAGGWLSIYGLSSPNVFHVYDPPPGSTVYMPSFRLFASPGPTTKMNLTITGPASATGARWIAPCGSGSGSMPYTLPGAFAECQGAAEFAVLALTQDASNALVGWGRVIEPSAPGTTIDVAIDTSNLSFETYTLYTSSLPAGSTAKLGFIRVMASNGLDTGATFPANPTLGYDSLYQGASGISDWLIESEQTMDGPRVSWSDYRSADSGFTTTVDLAAVDAALPQITAPLLDVADPVRPTATWGLTSGSTPPDLQFLQIAQTGTAGGLVQDWVVLPSGISSFRFPEVPSDQTATIPAPARFVFFGLAELERSDAAGYGAALALGSTEPPKAYRGMTPVVMRVRQPPP